MRIIIVTFLTLHFVPSNSKASFLKLYWELSLAPSFLLLSPPSFSLFLPPFHPALPFVFLPLTVDFTEAWNIKIVSVLFTILPHHFPPAEEPKISLSLCMEMYTNAHFLRSSVFLSCCIPKSQMNTQILIVTIAPIPHNQPVSARLSFPFLVAQ